ncbi:unnamed protein product [Blepharisma stoltei]|uniref:Polycystic kidney disease 2-like 1 protein n=1 Tax=Blepharisma stoltei TaxID=1481888 RepID=A0AAU9JVL6_9CILI|nr:unnamed protein product [Blepharisma stoltei]
MMKEEKKYQLDTNDKEIVEFSGITDSSQIYEERRSKVNFETKIVKELDEIQKEEKSEEIKLDEKALDEIENIIAKAEKGLEKSLEQKKVNERGVYISVIASTIFVVMCMFVNRAEKTADLTELIENILLKKPWQVGPDLYFKDIEKIHDIDKYLRMVFLPGILGDGFVENYNYAVGIRLSIKLARMEDNPFSEYEEAVWKVRSNPEMSPSLSNSDEITRPLFGFTYDHGGGFRHSGGYVLCFFNDNLQEALLKWRKYRDLMIYYEFESLAIETILHNSNMAATLYYYQTIVLESTGKMSKKIGNSGIFPETFETYSSIDTILLTCGSIYLIGFLIQVYNIFQTIIQTFKTLWAKLKFEFAWHEWLELISIIFVLASFGLFGSVILGNIGKYKLPITEEKDFTGLADYAESFRILVRLTALAALMTSFKIIVMLKNKFPSFGVLFDTIALSKIYIINFTLIIMFIFISFTLFGTLGFGLTYSKYSNFGESLLSITRVAYGDFDLKKLEIANVTLAQIFLVVFDMWVFFILKSTLIAIVIGSYIEVKNRDELLLQAKADMIKEKSNNIFRAIINFIFCRAKTTLNEDALEYQQLSALETMSPRKQNEINERLRKLEISIRNQNRLSIFDAVKYNLGQISQLMKFGGGMITREQFLQKIKDCIRKILKKRKIAEILRKQRGNDVDYNFTVLADLLIFIIFWSLFITLVVTRLEISYVYTISTQTKDSIIVPKFYSNWHNITFQEITTSKDAYSFMNEIFKNYMQKVTVNTQNNWISQIKARITFTRYRMSKNKSSFSNEVIQYVIPDTETQNTTDFHGVATFKKYIYSPSGSLKTYKSKGGYVIELNNKQNISDIIQQIELDDIFSRNLKDFYIEWVLYNPNVNMFSYSVIHFNKLVSGNIDPSIYSGVIDLDIYSSGSPMIVISILFFMFTILYLIKFCYSWYLVWKKVYKQRKEKTLIWKIARHVIDKIEENEISARDHCFRFTKKALTWYCYTIIDLLYSAWLLIKGDIFQLFSIVSTIMSLMMIYYEIMLVQSNFYQNFKLDSPFVAWKNCIGEFSEINDLLYISGTLAMFTCLILFLRLIQYFEFSDYLSNLTDVIKSASFDLAFFTIVFIIILAAYAISNYLVLGHHDISFKFMESSFLSTYSMLLCYYDIGSILQADNLLGAILFISYMVIFNFMMLNLFIAIIFAHYTALKSTRPKKRLGFFEKFWKVIKYKFQNRKLIIDPNKIKKIEDIADENLFVNYSPTVLEDAFIIDDKAHINSSSNKWLKSLEDGVSDHSGNEITFAKLKADFSKYCGMINTDLIQPIQLNEICFMNPEIWKDENVEQKIKIWKTLTNLYAQEYRLEIEKSVSEGKDIKEHGLSPLQKQLWEATPMNEKLEMWSGKLHFSEEERIKIWNSTNYSKEFMEKDANIEEQKNYWLSLTIAQKNDLVSKILGPFKGIKKKMKIEESFLDFYIKNEALFTNDTKMLLWASLYEHEISKFLLFMNQNDKVEAEIIAYMIMDDKKHNLFAMDHADLNMEAILDAKIFDKYTEMATFQAENDGKISCEERIFETNNEHRNLINYKHNLQEEQKTFIKKNKKLQKRVKELRSKLENR